jgi:hypothetical protein
MIMGLSMENYYFTYVPDKCVIISLMSETMSDPGIALGRFRRQQGCKGVRIVCLQCQWYRTHSALHSSAAATQGVAVNILASKTTHSRPSAIARLCWRVPGQ